MATQEWLNISADDVRAEYARVGFSLPPRAAHRESSDDFELLAGKWEVEWSPFRTDHAPSFHQLMEVAPLRDSMGSRSGGRCAQWADTVQSAAREPVRQVVDGMTVGVVDVLAHAFQLAQQKTYCSSEARKNCPPSPPASVVLSTVPVCTEFVVPSMTPEALAYAGVAPRVTDPSNTDGASWLSRIPPCSWVLMRGTLVPEDAVVSGIAPDRPSCWTAGRSIHLNDC